MDSIKEKLSGHTKEGKGNLDEEANIAQETSALSTSSFQASLSGGKRDDLVGKNKFARETAGKYGERDGKKFMWHPGFDARFPHMNQTRRCWQNYVDYFRCINRFGDDETRCEYFKKIFTIFCPIEWVERWDEQRDRGSFPASLE